jgi:hypothetical protein
MVAVRDLSPDADFDGHVLAGACRWYAFRIAEVREGAQRAEMEAEVVAAGRLRDFFGFNRAKHAVVEAAILATRVGILPAEHIRGELARLAAPVEKTGGAAERRALRVLDDYVRSALALSEESQ